MGNRKKNQPSYNSRGTFPFTPNASVTSRNLTRNQLGGVIFGCKNVTIRECLAKNLFGLPSGHISYVRNIEPGLPLFLFNFTDRKLHGIFQAASRGKMSIDPYAWTGSDGSSDKSKTQFPAQVQVRVQLQCQPLPEDKFRPVIEDNYYTNIHFWFELDHGQANKLMSLLSSSLSTSPGISVHQNKNWPTLSQPLPWHVPSRESAPLQMHEPELEHADHPVSPIIPFDQNKKWNTLFQPPPLHEPSRESEPFEMHDDGLEHYNDHSIIRSDSTENDFSLNGYIQPLDTDIVEKEENQDEKSLICIKLKELALSHENQNISLENDLNDTPDADANNICSVGKDLDTQVGLEKKEEGPSSLFEYPYNIAQLVQELSEFKNKQAETNYYLEQKLIKAELEIQNLKDRCAILESACNIKAELEIQNLKDRCAILESACNISPAHIEETVISSYAEMDFDPKDSLYLLGGYDGKSSLATIDLYSTSGNVYRSLKPMSSGRSYASVVQFKGEIYVIGGGNGRVWYDTVESYNPVHDNWTMRPSLNQEKGSLSGAVLNNKIFAVGGGNGNHCFADVEMLDLDIGRWIPTRSMLEKRFALAAAELNGVLYATGGFDEIDYLKSAERFDPREHSWTRIGNMNTKRGCHSLVVLNEQLYALGGFDGIRMIPNVEVFDPRLGVWMMAEPMNQPRGFFGAAVVKECIYVIGGVEVAENFVDAVENYTEDQGWKEIYAEAPLKRCFLSAIAFNHE